VILLNQIVQGFNLHIWKPSWFLAVLSALTCTFLAISQVRWLQINEGANANIWDVLFIVFNNRYLILYPFGLLFAFLVAQFSAQDSFGNYTLLRLKNRAYWWIGRVSVTLSAAMLYSLLFTVSIFLLATPSFPWSTQWSLLAQFQATTPSSAFVTPWLIAQTPIHAALYALLLLTLGAFTMGLSVQLGVIFAGYSFIGFAVAAVIIFVSVIVNNYGFTPTLPNVFIHMHWLLGAHHNSFPLWHSFLYWLGAIVIMVFAGYWRAKRLDFLA
jgi:hypothetical protein